MLQRTKLSSLLILCGLASAGPAFGQSGSFTFVTGDVNVQRRDGQRVSVTRGTPVNPGDAIVTGTHGMAQLTMVDQAKISLRPNTQFQIERYAERADSGEGALLRLVRGTLRTFTGLISSAARDRFVMKTKVATVGIRGSGNVLFAGTAADCDPAKVEASGAGCDITVNHTIEGSHSVTFGDFSGPGLPPQQGGAQTLITGPGQTVLVTGRGDVRYIPTPQFIADAATNPTGAAKSKGGGEGGGGETRNFGPNDSSGSSTQQGTTTTTPIGNNGLGFTVIDASGNLAADPSDLRDIVIAAAGSPFEGQATGADMTLASGSLRGYSAYAGTQTTVAPAIGGGTARDVQNVSLGGGTISMGRWEGASIGFFGGASSSVPGSIHWIYANSGYPTYLSDVLTGTATYTLVAATPPTNQLNAAGTLGSATLNVNFSNRTLDAALSVSVPGSGANAGGSWNLNAQAVPIALNTFYASTADRLVVTNSGGQSSTTNASLTGGIEGSFVGSSLQGAILGYGIADLTASNSSNHNIVSGVAAFTGPAQPGAAPFRDGLVSDPSGSLAGAELVRTYSATNRPDEVVADSATGQVSSFVAPLAGLGSHAVYSRGTASVAQSGVDPESGLVWGRWAGGTATVTSGGQTQNLNLANSSLHYIFSGAQSGPVALPLTGTATYDVIGSTSPTDALGHVGALNSASLNANFTTRTVDAIVNLAINGQTWNGRADAMPIYRDQYFSAFTPSSIPGASGFPQLVLTCTPNCGPGARGSLDGFFAGRTGQRAGVNYNFNGNAGAVAFGRRGG